MQTSVASCICNSSGRTIADLESVEEMMYSGCDRVSSDGMVDTRPEWRVFHSNNNSQSIGSPTQTPATMGRNRRCLPRNVRRPRDRNDRWLCREPRG